MPSPPELPEHLARIVDQLIELSVSDPEVYKNTARLDQRALALKNRFNSSLSTALAKRNDDHGRTGSCALPDDALFAVFDHLSFADVLTASQVCSQWRAVAIASPHLWTDLEMCARRADDESDSGLADSEDGYDWEYPTISNIHLLRKLLPRAQTQPLALTIVVTDAPFSEFVDRVIDFVEMVAPRLVALCFRDVCPTFLASVFDPECQWDLPMLRRFACSSSRELSSDNRRVDLSHVASPLLSHLDLGTEFQLVGLAAQPALKHLRTRADPLDVLVPLLSFAPALTHLDLAGCILRIGRTDLRAPRVDVPAALSAVRELSLRIQNTPPLMDGLLRFFQSLSCARVVLELTGCPEGFSPLPLDEEPAFEPMLYGVWADATQIVLRDAADAVELFFTDAARRTFAVRLLDDALRGAHTRCIDWKHVAALGALTSLHVDASIWRLVMHNFPNAPLLSDTTLAVEGADGLDAVMVDGACALDRFSPVRSGAILSWDQAGPWQPCTQVTPRGIVQLGGRLSAVPPAPRGATLVLSSDVPVSITKWRVADVKKRLLVERMVMDRGVSMRECPSTPDDDSTSECSQTF